MLWRSPTIKFILFYNCNFGTAMNRNTNIWYAGYVTFEPCERIILSERDHDTQVLIILWTKEIKLCFQILHKIDFIKNIVDSKAFKMEYLKRKRERPWIWKRARKDVWKGLKEGRERKDNVIVHNLKSKRKIKLT